MIALNFLDKNLTAFSFKDAAGTAKKYLQQTGFTEAIVLEGQHFEGMISKEDLIENDEKTLLKEIPCQIHDSVGPQSHFFEIWTRIVENHLSCIAVVNDHDEFIGIISKQSLIQFYGQCFAMTEPGCIIVLSQRRMDYSLSKIARIIEEQDCNVLGTFVSDASDAGSLFITLKLNCQDAQGIVSSFQRYGIEVVELFSEERFNDPMQERFNMLMSYLNL